MLLRADTRVDLLRGLPLFELCSKRDLRRIAAIAVEREVEAGTELIREGEPGTEFYVVVEGEVDVRRRGRRVARLGNGSFVGEIALLSRSPRTATVIAVDAAPRARDLGPRLRRAARHAARALAEGRAHARRPRRRRRGDGRRLMTAARSRRARARARGQLRDPQRDPALRPADDARHVGRRRRRPRPGQHRGAPREVPGGRARPARDGHDLAAGRPVHVRRGPGPRGRGRARPGGARPHRPLSRKYRGRTTTSGDHVRARDPAHRARDVHVH